MDMQGNDDTVQTKEQRKSGEGGMMKSGREKEEGKEEENVHTFIRSMLLALSTGTAVGAWVLPLKKRKKKKKSAMCRVHIRAQVHSEVYAHLLPFALGKSVQPWLAFTSVPVYSLFQYEQQ